MGIASQKNRPLVSHASPFGPGTVSHCPRLMARANGVGQTADASYQTTLYLKRTGARRHGLPSMAMKSISSP